MQTYAEKIKLLKITGRWLGEGKGPISVSPYVQPQAVFAFTRPASGRRGVCCDHTAGYYKKRISGFYPDYINGYPDFKKIRI